MGCSLFVNTGATAATAPVIPIRYYVAARLPRQTGRCQFDQNNSWYYRFHRSSIKGDLLENRGRYWKHQDVGSTLRLSLCSRFMQDLKNTAPNRFSLSNYVAYEFNIVRSPWFDAALVLKAHKKAEV